MNPKRVAGVLNLLLAAVAIWLGVTRREMMWYFIAAFMLLIGYLRLRRTS
jgi:hypothetical protein